MRCSACHSTEFSLLVDLGHSPIANNFLDEIDTDVPEPYFRLKVVTCKKCTLCQLSTKIQRENLFNTTYLYHSSYSESWLSHVAEFADMVSNKINLGMDELVVEIASNDGYLLQYFEKKGILTLGIEPAKEVAEIAISRGIETKIEFFGEEYAEELRKNYKPKLIIANNVLAHVPDLRDFIAGISKLLSDEAIATIEFPHISKLLRENQFDTIYHEHYSYLGLTPLIPLFSEFGIKIFDVEKLTTHGGSLRIYAALDNSSYEISKTIYEILALEKDLNPSSYEVQLRFQKEVKDRKLRTNLEILGLKIHNKRIAGYGAAAKGNTILNYFGLNYDHIDYIVDLNKSKQKKFLPGSHIPVVGIDHLLDNPPDYLILFPWNLKDEIIYQIRELNLKSKFILLSPEFSIL